MKKTALTYILIIITLFLIMCYLIPFLYVKTPVLSLFAIVGYIITLALIEEISDIFKTTKTALKEKEIFNHILAGFMFFGLLVAIMFVVYTMGIIPGKSAHSTPFPNTTNVFFVGSMLLLLPGGILLIKEI